LITTLPSHLQMVDCPARMLTLSSTSCVADYLRAAHKKPDPWESRWHCYGCRLGAERAGLPVRSSWPAGVCVRCHREGLRIVTRTGLCVSCYNRQHEVERGQNAKGDFPSLTALRYTFCARVLSVGDDGSKMLRRTVSQTTSVVEGILTTLRVSHTSQTFGRAAHDAGSQGTFWGGA